MARPGTPRAEAVAELCAVQADLLGEVDREAYEERAAILEHGAGFPRVRAEARAMDEVLAAIQARVRAAPTP